ncbi:MAG: hypothetical protein ACYSU7_05815 [Planctomycetota bacterium]|jgi:hypothetical protein
MRGKLAAVLVVAAIPAAPAAADTILDLDPGVTPVWGSGGSTGRSVYLTANETFTIDTVGLRGDILAGLYDIVIHEGQGVTTAAGSALQMTSGNTGGRGDVFNDIGIDFTFQAGVDYIVNFRPSDGNGVWVIGFPYYRWGDTTGDDVDLGLVTIRDGRAGFDSDNWTNTVAPVMRLHVAPAPGGLAVLALAGVLRPRRRRR